MKKLILTLILVVTILACKKTTSTTPAPPPQNNTQSPPPPTQNTLTAQGTASALIGAWIWDSVVNLNGGNVYAVYKPYRPQGVDTLVNNFTTLDQYTITLTNNPFQNAGNGSGISSSNPFSYNYGEVNVVEKCKSGGTIYSSNAINSWAVSPNIGNTYIQLSPISNPTENIGGIYTIITNYPSAQTRIRTLTVNVLILSSDINSTVLNGQVYYYHK